MRKKINENNKGKFNARSFTIARVNDDCANNNNSVFSRKIGNSRMRYKVNCLPIKILYWRKKTK